MFFLNTPLGFITSSPQEEEIRYSTNVRRAFPFLSYEAANEVGKIYMKIMHGREDKYIVEHGRAPKGSESLTYYAVLSNVIGAERV